MQVDQLSWVLGHSAKFALHAATDKLQPDSSKVLMKPCILMLHVS